MEFKQDIKFAKKVCEGDKQAHSEFFQLISDELYYLASKFNSLGIKEDYWEYRTKKGYTIKVDDDVGDTSLWLFNYAIKKTCKYQGLAPLVHFINCDLFKDWTRKIWVRHKTGVTSYVPKVVETLSDLHINIYKELRFKKSTEQIMQKFNLSKPEYFEYYNHLFRLIKVSSRSKNKSNKLNQAQYLELI